jgi:DNA-directed RNA polymerase subunit K/omega
MENTKSNYSLDIEKKSPDDIDDELQKKILISKKNKKNDDDGISDDEQHDIDDESDEDINHDDSDVDDNDDDDDDDDDDIEQINEIDIEDKQQNIEALDDINYISENPDYNNNLDILYNNINLQKIDAELKDNYIENFHSECLNIDKNELDKLSKVTRDNSNNIVDEFHKTISIMTKYEKTRILGIRTKQLNNGNIPYVSVDEGLNNNYLIALKELNEKRLPFIIKRPMPNNKFEYWKLTDLEIL